MRRESYVCSVCKRHVENAFDRYEERHEIRSADRKRSLWSDTIVRFCKSCAEGVVAGRRSRQTAGQETLL